jgi:cytochrome c oxidase subunit 3
MQAEYEKELSPEVKEKMKKNLVYIGIFSVVMLFAGFSSAYIVSMGDAFWLKYNLPSAFWASTITIGLSSLTYILAIQMAKRDSQKGVKVGLVTTAILGIAFAFFQFQGYKQLTSMGAYAVNNHIIVTDGRYGDYYELYVDGEAIKVDGNNFSLKGKDLNESQWKKVKDFMNQFATVNPQKDFKVKNYGKGMNLTLNGKSMALLNGTLKKNDGTDLEYTDRLRLTQLAMNMVNERGDFFMKGQLGTDFHIFYKGEELSYKDRELYWEGKKLSKYLQLKATETADSGTSFLYILTFLHLLHILVAVVYLLKITTRSFSGVFNSENYLSIKLGGIFWHFLGLLWLYLLLFLLFIH